MIGKWRYLASTPGGALPEITESYSYSGMVSAILENQKITSRRDPLIGVTHSQAAINAFDNLDAADLKTDDLVETVTDFLATGRMDPALKRLQNHKNCWMSNYFFESAIPDKPFGWHRDYKLALYKKFHPVANPNWDLIEEISKIMFGKRGSFIIDEFATALPNICLPNNKLLIEATLTEAINSIANSSQKSDFHNLIYCISIIMKIRCFEQAITYCRIIQKIRNEPFGDSACYSFKYDYFGSTWLNVHTAPAALSADIINFALEDEIEIEDPDEIANLLISEKYLPYNRKGQIVEMINAFYNNIPDSLNNINSIRPKLRHIQKIAARSGSLPRRFVQQAGLMKRDFVECNYGLNASQATAYVAMEFLWAVNDVVPFIESKILGKPIQSPSRNIGFSSKGRNIIKHENISIALQALQFITNCRDFVKDTLEFREGIGREAYEYVIRTLKGSQPYPKFINEVRIDLDALLAPLRAINDD